MPQGVLVNLDRAKFIIYVSNWNFQNSIEYGFNIEISQFNVTWNSVKHLIDDYYSITFTRYVGSCNIQVFGI